MPDQLDERAREKCVQRVAQAMADAHHGPGLDPAGYVQQARSFVAAAEAYQDAREVALDEAKREQADEEAAREAERREAEVHDDGGGEPAPESPGPLREDEPAQQAIA